MVCNFLDGLKEMLAKRRRTSPTSGVARTTPDANSDTTPPNTWILQSDEQRELIDSIASDTASPAALRVSGQPLVHSYSSSPYADEQYSAFHDSTDAEITTEPSSTDNTQQNQLAEELFAGQRLSETGNRVDMFSREYFDEAFYNRLFKLVVSSPRLRKRPGQISLQPTTTSFS